MRKKNWTGRALKVVLILVLIVSMAGCGSANTENSFKTGDTIKVDGTLSLTIDCAGIMTDTYCMVKEGFVSGDSTVSEIDMLMNAYGTVHNCYGSEDKPLVYISGTMKNESSYDCKIEEAIKLECNLNDKDIELFSGNTSFLSNDGEEIDYLKAGEECRYFYGFAAENGDIQRDESGYIKIGFANDLSGVTGEAFDQIDNVYKLSGDDLKAVLSNSKVDTMDFSPEDLLSDGEKDLLGSWKYVDDYNDFEMLYQADHSLKIWIDGEYYGETTWSYSDGAITVHFSDGDFDIAWNPGNKSYVYNDAEYIRQ